MQLPLKKIVKNPRVDSTLLNSYKLNLIFGIVFLAISIIVILLTDISPMFIPSQDIGLRSIPELGPVYKGNLFIQELTARKDYIYGIKMVLGNWEAINDNDNVLFLTDNNYQILYTQKIKSKEIRIPDFYAFPFHKKIRLGKGNKFYLCMYSINGEEHNNIALGRLVTGSLGKLYVSSIPNDDVITALKKKDLFFDGSFCVKTYETDDAGMSFFKGLFLLSAVCISLIIVFFGKIRRSLEKVRFVPQNIFLFFSLLAGLLLVFVTPPLQVPDEQSHFYRSYQLSELNVYQYDRTVPKALSTLSDFSSGMNFKPLVKTTNKEIMAQSKIRIDPLDRLQVRTLGMVVPMIPQTLGIGIGKLFHSSPLWLLYWGRILNLLAAVVLIYFAIRISPVQKWIFFLLGLMPMTLFQLSSLSYDAISLSLTFFVIAFNLNLAFNKLKTIRTADLVILFISCFLLAMCKLPYFIAGFLFILVPVTKLGSWKKYILLFIGLTITMYIGTQIYSFSRPWFQPPQTAVVQAKLVNQATIPARPADSLAAIKEERVNSFNAEAQKQFILNNFNKYIDIVINTMKPAAWPWIQSFVGVLGWIDTFLPSELIMAYLFVILFIAIGMRNPGIRIGLLSRFVFLLLFSAGIMIILTGLYLYANDTASPIIQAVQGRYFIPFAPLLLLIFYNNRDLLPVIGKPKTLHEKTIGRKLKNKKQSATEIKPERFPLENFLAPLIILFTIISLLTLFWVVLNRYYNLFV
jgi:uncharacterized membrane protein